MRSLMQEVLKPATVVLLDALNDTMNSNTMLFKVQGDQPLTTDNDQTVLKEFLRSSLFAEVFLEFAWWREPHYYIVEDVVDGKLIVRSPAGRLVPASAQVTLTPLNERTFAERIHWMLTAGYSPYRRHLSEERAQEIIHNFFWEIFTPERLPFEQPEARSYWSEHPWSFYDVAPNFLYSTGYFDAIEGYEPPDFAYFDGGEADTATFFYKNEIFYLLLTNGSS